MIDPFAHHRASSDFQTWVKNDFQNMFPKFSNDLFFDDSVVYQKKKEFSNMRGATLMLVGAGPSSLSESWKLEKYDYLWTMNQFYKSDIFRDVKVDLAMIMGETNLRDPEFLEKRNKDNILIGFESHDRWENYRFDEYENYFCMHTKFYGKIGIGARMKMFAACLGFEEVMFTGFDGPEQIFLGNHSFEPGKKTLPSVFDGQSLESVSYHHKAQYDFLWRLIRQKYSKVSFKNLGGGTKYHEECR